MKTIRLSILLVAVTATLSLGFVAPAGVSAKAPKATVVHVVERATTDAVTNGDPDNDKLGRRS